MRFPILSIVALYSLTALLPMVRAGGMDDVTQAIDHILHEVAASDCTFIRNGKEYDGKEAEEHMRRKYDHFRKDIETPEDFIRLAGTKSLMSGKKYMVRTTDGEEVATAEWLSARLVAYRKPDPS